MCIINIALLENDKFYLVHITLFEWSMADLCLLHPAKLFENICTELNALSIFCGFMGVFYMLCRCTSQNFPITGLHLSIMDQTPSK